MAIQNQIQPIVTNNQPQAGAQQRPPRRFFSARLALLAMMIYNPVLLVIVIIYVNNSSAPCAISVAQLCQFEQWMPIEQIGAIVLVWFVIWVLLYIFFGWSLEQTGTPKNALSRGLRAISAFQNIRDLLAIYAAVLIMGLVAAFFLRKLTWPLATLVVLTSGVCFWAYLSRPARAPRDLYGRPGGPLYMLRSIPPLRWFWPNPYAPPPGQNPLGNLGAGIAPQPPVAGVNQTQAGSPPPLDDEPADNQQIQPGESGLLADPQADDPTLPAAPGGLASVDGQPPFDTLTAPTIVLRPSSEPSEGPPAFDDKTIPARPGEMIEQNDQPTLISDPRNASRDQQPSS